MNFVPKLPADGALLEVFSGLAAPAVVLDAERGRLLAANAAGQELWGCTSDSLPEAALDRAMPALVHLRQQAREQQHMNSDQAPLTFWTRRGLLASPCRCERLAMDADAAVFLVTWPQLAGAGSPLASESRQSLDAALSNPDMLDRIARRIREKSLSQASAAVAKRPDSSAGGTAGTTHDRTLANLAHELRTPLAAVIALAEIMTEEHLGPLPNERYRGYLGDIRDSARHGLALVDSLLARGSGSDGKIETVCSEVDLNETARACLATMQPLADKAGISLDTSLAENLPRVVADVRAVKQILLNLLANSVKYAGRGAKVTVRTGYELASRAWFEVTDTGPGIAPDVAACVLDHGSRAATAGVPASGGLGLPLSRRLAQANGARLEIDTACNGAAVRVVFAKDRIVPV